MPPTHLIITLLLVLGGWSAQAANRFALPGSSGDPQLRTQSAPVTPSIPMATPPLARAASTPVSTGQLSQSKRSLREKRPGGGDRMATINPYGASTKTFATPLRGYRMDRSGDSGPPITPLPPLPVGAHSGTTTTTVMTSPAPTRPAQTPAQKPKFVQLPTTAIDPASLAIRLVDTLDIIDYANMEGRISVFTQSDRYNTDPNKPEAIDKRKAELRKLTQIFTNGYVNVPQGVYVAKLLTELGKLYDEEGLDQPNRPDVQLLATQLARLALTYLTSIVKRDTFKADGVAKVTPSRIAFYIGLFEEWESARDKQLLRKAQTLLLYSAMHDPLLAPALTALGAADRLHSLAVNANNRAVDVNTAPNLFKAIFGAGRGRQ